MPRLKINGVLHTVDEGSSVAAAVMNSGLAGRTSLTGEARGPLCGMGICFECRVMIDGELHQRGCLVQVREGMEVDDCVMKPL